MFFIFKRGMQVFGHKDPPPQPGGIWNGLLINGILCILFGICILLAPELLAYIVAAFLMVIGASMVATWYRMRRFTKKGWH